MSRNWSYVKGAFKNLNAANTISNIAKKKTYENDEEINNVHQSGEGDDYLKAGDSGDDDGKLYHALSKEVRGGGSSDTIDGTNQADTRKGTKKNSSCDGNNAIDKEQRKKRNRTHKKKRKSDKKNIADKRRSSELLSVPAALAEEVEQQRRQKGSDKDEIVKNDREELNAAINDADPLESKRTTATDSMHIPSPMRKKKTKKKRSKMVKSTTEKDDNIDAATEKEMKRKKRKFTKKKKKKKDNNVKKIDEKDRTILNLKRELSKRDDKIGSLNETLKSLKKKMQLMEHEIRDNFILTDLALARNNVSSSKSIDGKENEEYISKASENLSQNDCDARFENESISRGLAISDEEDSINMHDVFGVPLLEQSSSEESLSQKDLNLAGHDDLTRVSQLYRDHRSFSQFEFSSKKSESCTYNMYEKLSKSVPEHLFNAEYNWNLSKDRDDIFDLAPKSPFRKNGLSKSYSRIRSNGSGDFSKCVQKHLYNNQQQSLKRSSYGESGSHFKINDDFDTRSLDQDELFDTQTPNHPSKKPLLTAALKAKALISKSEPCLNFDNDFDTRSLDLDELFDTQTPNHPSKKPLLTAALKAKALISKSERCLNFDNAFDTRSLDLDELFEDRNQIQCISNTA